MNFRATTLCGVILALSITSPASAGDGEDFLRMLLNHALNQHSPHRSGHGQQHNDHHDHHSHQGPQFQQVQRFNPGPGPSVQPFVNPGITQPRLDINGRYVCGEGMLITRVICGGLAERIGLERGDTIVAINGQTVTSRSHFHDLLRDAVVCYGGRASLLVRRDCGRPSYVTMHVHFPISNGPVVHHHHP